MGRIGGLTAMGIGTTTSFRVSPEEARTAETLMSLLDSLGAQDLIYLSVPITGGPREYELLAELGCTREELRRVHSSCYEERVVRPNHAAASAVAAALRQRTPDHTVINPADLWIPGASQALYNYFWTEVIRTRVSEVHLGPGWTLSFGARLEAFVGLRLGLAVYEVDGGRVDDHVFQDRLREAAEWLDTLPLASTDIAQALSIALPVLAEA